MITTDQLKEMADVFDKANVPKENRFTSQYMTEQVEFDVAPELSVKDLCDIMGINL
jgi:hypothetical protein